MNAFLAKMFVFVIFAMVIVADTSPKHCNALYKMSPKCPDSCRRQSLSFFRTKSHHHYLYHHREYYKKQYFYKNRRWNYYHDYRLHDVRRNTTCHDVHRNASHYVVFVVCLLLFCLIMLCVAPHCNGAIVVTQRHVAAKFAAIMMILLYMIKANLRHSPY